MVHRMTTSDNEWYNEFQRMTTSNNEWQRVVHQVTTSGTTSDNECQRVTIPANFTFQIKEEPTTKHPKENFLNLEEDLWRRPIELRAETSTQKEILTVRSRNCRSSCSQIFTKILLLKILQYSAFNRFAGFKTYNFLKKRLQHGCFPALEPLFVKVLGLEPCKYIKRRLQHRCFPVNIAKFLKTAFSIEHLWWLLLELRHFLVCDV